MPMELYSHEHIYQIDLITSITVAIAVYCSSHMDQDVEGQLEVAIRQLTAGQRQAPVEDGALCVPVFLDIEVRDEKDFDTSVNDDSAHVEDRPPQ